METRKVYVKPEIIHEMDLETRAGSCIDLFCDPEPTPPCGDPID